MTAAGPDPGNPLLAPVPSRLRVDTPRLADGTRPVAVFTIQHPAGSTTVYLDAYELDTWIATQQAARAGMTTLAAARDLPPGDGHPRN